MKNVGRESPEELSEQLRSQLKFLDKRGAPYLLVAAISSCVEVILGKAVPNRFEIGFNGNLSPEQAALKWGEILDIFLALSLQLDDCFLRNRITNQKLKETISRFSGVITSLAPSYKPTFNKFASEVQTG